jgi:hypothetical protein
VCYRAEIQKLVSDPKDPCSRPSTRQLVLRRRRQRWPSRCVCTWWALIALGEEAKRVDLLDEVCHAGPAAEPEANHQHPRHHERVHKEHPRPARQEGRRLLRRVLQKKASETLATMRKQHMHASEQISGRCVGHEVPHSCHVDEVLR